MESGPWNRLTRSKIANIPFGGSTVIQEGLDREGGGERKVPAKNHPSNNRGIDVSRDGRACPRVQRLLSSQIAADETTKRGEANR